MINELIRANQQKKQADKDRSINIVKGILDSDSTRPEVKDWAWNTYAGLIGGDLDIPKKHHGIFGKLLGSFHDHLSNLNPNPKDRTQPLLATIPHGHGPATQGLQIPSGDAGWGAAGLAGTTPDIQQADDAAMGGRLPGVAEYKTSPYSTEEVAANQAAARRGIQGADQQAEVARIREAVAKGDISKTLGERAIGNVLTNSHGSLTTGMTAKPDRQEVHLKDTPSNAWIPAEITTDENGQSVYKRLNGEDIDPSDIEQIRKNRPNDYNRNSTDYNDRVKALHARYKDATDEQINAAAAEYITEKQDSVLKKLGVNIASAQQGINIKKDATGIGTGGAADVKIPAPGSLPAGATGRDPSGLIVRPPISNRVEATRKANGTPADSKFQKWATGPNSSTKAAPAGSPAAQASTQAGQTYTASDGKVRPALNPMKLAKLAQDNPLVARGMLMLEGTTTFTGLQKQGALRGVAILMKETGLTSEELSSELTERKGTKEGLQMQSNRIVAINAAANQVTAMGQAVLAVRKLVGSNPQIIQKAINDYNNNIKGSPETAALVQAIQGWVSAYSRAITGGQMSKGQTHVAALETAGKILTAEMTAETDQAVLQQGEIEIAKETGAAKEAAKEASQSIARPFGSFVHPEWFAEKAEANGDDRIRVQIPGQPPGRIPKSKVEEFKKAHPNGKVLQ